MRNRFAHNLVRVLVAAEALESAREGDLANLSQLTASFDLNLVELLSVAKCKPVRRFLKGLLSARCSQSVDAFKVGLLALAAAAALAARNA